MYMVNGISFDYLLIKYFTLKGRLPCCCFLLGSNTFIMTFSDREERFKNPLEVLSGMNSYILWQIAIAQRRFLRKTKISLEA